MHELWRFERGKGGWEHQSTIVRKASEGLPPPLSHYSDLGFTSSLFPQEKPREFSHKLSFFDPPFLTGFFHPHKFKTKRGSVKVDDFNTS